MGEVYGSFEQRFVRPRTFNKNSYKLHFRYASGVQPDQALDHVGQPQLELLRPCLSYHVPAYSYLSVGAHPQPNSLPPGSECLQDDTFFVAQPQPFLPPMGPLLSREKLNSFISTLAWRCRQVLQAAATSQLQQTSVPQPSLQTTSQSQQLQQNSNSGELLGVAYTSQPQGHQLQQSSVELLSLGGFSHSHGLSTRLQELVDTCLDDHISKVEFAEHFSHIFTTDIRFRSFIDNLRSVLLSTYKEKVIREMCATCFQFQFDTGSSSKYESGKELASMERDVSDMEGLGFKVDSVKLLLNELMEETINKLEAFIIRCREEAERSREVP